MRNLLSTLLVFSFLFTIGCEDDEASSDTLVGAWNLASVSVTLEGTTTNQEANSEYSLVLIISEEGTISLDGGFPKLYLSVFGVTGNELYICGMAFGSFNIGTWSTAGSKLTLDWDRAGENISAMEIWDYTLSGDNLTLSSTGEDYCRANASVTYNWNKE